MKWTCSHCNAINPSGAFKCHNCPNTAGDECLNNPTKERGFPPRVNFAKKFLQEDGFPGEFARPNSELLPAIKDRNLFAEYLSMIEHEALLAAMTKRAEEGAASLIRKKKKHSGKQ